MSSLTHHFATMAYNNAWSNERLLTAMGRLDHSEFVAARTVFFPSLKATMNHIVTVDWFYVDALERASRRLGPNLEARKFFEPEEPFDDCAALHVEQRAVDKRLVSLCTDVVANDGDLEAPVDILRPEGPVRESMTRILAHLFQHQIHHRGQAHAMLSGTSVAPPQLDEFFCVNEAHLRAPELARLGYSEALIWGQAPRI